MYDLEFKTPTRQSYAAIILIIYRFYKTLVRQLWPFLLVFLFSGRLQENSIFIISIGVIASITAVYGIIAFFKYFFYLESEELVIEKGVIRKSRTSIPLDRIQSVDFEQNLLHRFFNVVRLKIDTAGSSSKELNLQALKKETAEALRSKLLSGASRRQNIDSHTIEVADTRETASELILEVDFPELLKLGISANHIKSAWIIFFFFYWMFENLRDAGVPIDKIKSYLPEGSVILQSLALLLSLIFLFVLVSFLFSLVRMVLQYFGLRLVREKNKFKVIAGLFNRRETAALDNKIQVLSWSQNMLQRGLGLFELGLRQASSVELKLKKNILVPGVKEFQISKVKGYLFKGLNEAFSRYSRTQIIYFYRFSGFLSLFGLAAITIASYFGAYTPAMLIFLFVSYQILSLYLRSKKYRIAFNEDLLIHGSGVFGNKFSLLELHKIQSISLKQSLYQRRHQLADLRVNTAGGYVSIPYLKVEDARRICDYCLAKVETSVKKWM